MTINDVETKEFKAKAAMNKEDVTQNKEGGDKELERASSGSNIGKRKAVVVGINDYDGTINDLPSCVKDAESISFLLANKLGFKDIKTFLDDNATKDNVSTALDWLFENATQNDTLVFYYSAHGAQKTVNGVTEEYLVLRDGLLQDDIISSKSQNLPSDTVFTMILDSCFGGGLEKKVFEKVENIQTLVTRAFANSNTNGLTSLRNGNLAKVKSFIFNPDEMKEIIENGNEAVTYKPFLRAKRLAAPIQVSKELSTNPASDEAGQLQMKGLLLSACLETQTASASIPSTNGLSAFTYALLKALEKLGVGASTNQLIKDAANTLEIMGFRQTPVLKEPPSAVGLGEKPFLNMQVNSEAAQDNLRTIAMIISELLSNKGNGQNSTSISDLLNLMVSIKNQQSGGQQKLFGIDDAVIIPAIVTLATAAMKGQQAGGDKSLLGDVIRTAGEMVKGQQAGGQQKPFWMDDSIIPIIANIATAAMKGQQSGGQQKLFGIDDAIIIPAIVTLATAAMKGQQAGGDKSLLGDVIRTAGEMVKGQQAGGQQKPFWMDDSIIPIITNIATAAMKGQQSGGQQKLFGIDDAIIIPAIVTLATAAMKGQQAGGDKSLLGDVIRTAGEMVKGQQAGGQQKPFWMDDSIIPIITNIATAAMKGQQSGGQQKLFGIDDAIIIPAIVTLATAAMKGQQAGGDKSLLGDVIRTAGEMVKGQQAGGQQKPFWMDDSIIPIITNIATAAMKGQQSGGQQKLFGIDDAIIIPAIVTLATAAMKGQQAGGDKSLLGDVIRTAGEMVKGQQAGGQQKIAGIDDAILIPAIVTLVAAAMKGQQPGGNKGIFPPLGCTSPSPWAGI